jgi:hypothetical protein
MLTFKVAPESPSETGFTRKLLPQSLTSPPGRYGEWLECASKDAAARRSGLYALPI